MGGNRRTILALFIWAMAAVIFIAAIRPNRTPALHTSILFALYTFFLSISRLSNVYRFN